jgi:hypothetical protein
MDLGLSGEGLVDGRVWVVKSHFPERIGNLLFGAERAILLVRSPLDAITSLFHMVGTSSHDQSISDQSFDKFQEEWTHWVQQEATVWRDFHSFWMTSKTPIHVIRYEDILYDREQAITDLMKFMFCQQSIKGTRIESYVKLACREEAPCVYKPRAGKVNSNIDRFSPELV